MKNKIELIDTTPDNITNHTICAYKNIKQEGYRRKVEWLTERYKEGLKYKVLYSEDGGTIGFIEYIPGEYAWKPVIAPGYMVIHCIAIFKRNVKSKGYGNMMLNECINDAKNLDKSGVCVIARKGSFMPTKDLFVKNGFELVDSAKPDYELFCLKFKDDKSPIFHPNTKNTYIDLYKTGLTIFYCEQCPYFAKAVNEISETAKEMNLKVKLIKFNDPSEAQGAYSPFGVFNILYNGILIAEHIISNTRFKNIITKLI